MLNYLLRAVWYLFDTISGNCGEGLSTGTAQFVLSQGLFAFSYLGLSLRLSSLLILLVTFQSSLLVLESGEVPIHRCCLLPNGDIFVKQVRTVLVGGNIKQ